MDAEPSGFGHRIDEVAERRFGPAHVEVISFGEEAGRNVRAVESLHARREIPGVEARGVDEEIGFDLGRLAPAGQEPNLAAGYGRFENRRAKCDSGAGGLDIGLVRQHQSVAVDNSGRA
jgi:hypothetical protein